jgi:hypothetical protein
MRRHSMAVASVRQSRERRVDLNANVSAFAAGGTEQPHQGVCGLSLVGSHWARSSYEALVTFAPSIAVGTAARQNTKDVNDT